MDWEHFFRLMIIDERAARAKYELALGESNDPEVRAVLERLRDEEAFHIQFIEENLGRLAQKHKS